MNEPEALWRREGPGGASRSELAATDARSLAPGATNVWTSGGGDCAIDTEGCDVQRIYLRLGVGFVRADWLLGQIVCLF